MNCANLCSFVFGGVYCFFCGEVPLLQGKEGEKERV